MHQLVPVKQPRTAVEVVPLVCICFFSGRGEVYLELEKFENTKLMSDKHL